MKFEAAVVAACKAAYWDVSDYVIGRAGSNDDAWQVARKDDLDARARMIEPTYLCNSAGITGAAREAGEEKESALEARFEKRRKDLQNIKEYLMDAGNLYAQGRKTEIENEINFLQGLLKGTEK